MDLLKYTILVLLTITVLIDAADFQSSLNIALLTNGSNAEERYCEIVDKTNVVCDSNYSMFDLFDELKHLSELQVNGSHHFANLFIQRSVVRQISNDAFQWISFDSVHVYSAEQLEQLDLFDADNHYLSKQMFINSPSCLNADSVRKLLILAPNLIQIQISLSSTTQVIKPESTHNCQNSTITNQLKYLIYQPNNFAISSIENFAFDLLPNLEAIKLANIPIHRISRYAFYSSCSSSSHSPTYTINLDNCHITDGVLDTGLSVSNFRPVSLILDNNQISHISESTFHSFLNDGNNCNTVSFFNNALNCTDLQAHRWLLNGTVRDKYSKQIFGAKCLSGQNLFDIQLYDASCAFDPALAVLRCKDIVGKTLDMHQELVFLRQSTDIQLNWLDRVIISNCNIRYIPANFFDNIPVRNIQLDGLANLSQIHQYAFGGGDVQTLNITGPNKLLPISETNSNANIWRIINSMTNLRRLCLSFKNSGFITISSTAFTKAVRMQSIEFSPNFYKIVNVESNAFSTLADLVYISFANIYIYEIGVDAFHFAAKSDLILKINLYNCNLDETKLRNKPFDRTNRPIWLDLTNNSIEILEQSAFEFVDKDARTRIDLNYNSIKCNFGNISSELHPHYWIYRRLKTTRNQILNAKCWDVNIDFIEYLQLQFNSSSSTSPTLSNTSHRLIVLFTLILCYYNNYLIDAIISDYKL